MLDPFGRALRQKFCGYENVLCSLRLPSKKKKKINSLIFVAHDHMATNQFSGKILACVAAYKGDWRGKVESEREARSLGAR